MEDPRVVAVRESRNFIGLLRVPWWTNHAITRYHIANQNATFKLHIVSMITVAGSDGTGSQWQNDTLMSVHVPVTSAALDTVSKEH
jgi:hypothetical protein